MELLIVVNGSAYVSTIMAFAIENRWRYGTFWTNAYRIAPSSDEQDDRMVVPVSPEFG